MAKISFGKYSVETSNTDKIFFPEDKITKGELINYYKEIADKMIPNLKDRPVSMLRMPNGIKGEIFFQKDAPDYFPDWIKSKKIKKKKGGTVNHVICNNKAALVYLANQACVTPHTWLSRIDKLNKPDRMIFDLDPSSKNFSEVKEAAKILKDFFTKELKLNIFLMTTGSRGLHVVLSLIRNENFEFVRKFAQDAAKILANRHSKKLTIEVRKNKRRRRIFLDTARNAYAQTAVPPYSVRPKEKAPIAVPIEWDELSNNNLNSQSYNIKNIFSRLSKKSDPWKNMNQKKNSLKNARKILDEIIKKEMES